MLQNLFKIIIAAAVFCTSLHSQAGILSLERYVRTAKEFEDAGIVGIRAARDSGGKVVYQYVDNAGATVTSFAFEKTSKEILRQYKPSAIQELLTSAALTAPGKGTIKIGKVVGKGAVEGLRIAARKLKHFPAEAFTFFVALGALQAGKVIFNYNSNPNGFDTYLSSQQNLVGHVGFAAFMVANGLATEPFQAALENSKFRFLLPHLGMSVGMLASNITHEVLSLPHLGECAASMLPSTDSKSTKEPKADLNACDKAFEEFLNINWSEKGHEWAPSLFALCASSAAGMVAESVLKKVGIMAAQAAAVRIAAIDIGMLVTPGGWLLKGATWTYKIVNIAGITVLQEFLDAPIRFFWNNQIDLAPHLNNSNVKLGQWIAFKNANAWAATNQDEQFLKEMDEFKNTMYRWRQSNMDSVLRAHADWSSFLATFTGQYRVSKRFYQDFVSDVWKKTFELNPDYKHLMDRQLPLYGVYAQGIDYKNDDDLARFFTQPGKIQDAQMQTVAILTNWITKNPKVIDAYMNEMYPAEQNTTREIIKQLFSTDPMVVGKAIQQMKYSLEVEIPQNLGGASDSFRNLLKKSLQALGRPAPLFATGQGYLRAMATNPNGSDLYQVDPFAGPLGNGWLPVTDRLVMAMATGPDMYKNESTIQNNLAGFPVTFNPPMIRLQGDFQTAPAALDLQTVNETKNSDLFNQNFWVNVDGTWRGGGTMLDFLRQGGIRPTVLGTKDAGTQIVKFWEQYPENQTEAALVQYQSRYEGIMVDFLRTLKKTDRDFFNASPFSNGPLEALENEFNIYLAILDSQLNAASGVQPMELPATATAKYNDKVYASKYFALDVTKAILAKNTNAWTSLMKTEWKKSRAMISNISEIQTRHENETITKTLTHVSNDVFTTRVKNIEALLKTYPLYVEPKKENASSDLLNANQPAEEVVQTEDTAGDNSTEQVTAPQVLNPAAVLYKQQMQPSQVQIVQFAIEGMKAAHQEMLEYLKIINAVSFVDNFKGQVLDEPVRPNCADKSQAHSMSSGCYENKNKTPFTR